MNSASSKRLGCNLELTYCYMSESETVDKARTVTCTCMHAKTRPYMTSTAGPPSVPKTPASAIAQTKNGCQKGKKSFAPSAAQPPSSANSSKADNLKRRMEQWRKIEEEAMREQKEQAEKEEEETRQEELEGEREERGELKERQQMEREQQEPEQQQKRESVEEQNMSYSEVRSLFPVFYPSCRSVLQSKEGV